MKKYDMFLMQLDKKMRPIILNETADMMSVITAYNVNPRLADAEFAGTLMAMYLLYIAGVPLNTDTLAPVIEEVNAAMAAITDLRDKIIEMSDNQQFSGYMDNLSKQGKKFEA